MVKHVHLERVEGRGEALDERPHPLEVCQFLVGLEAQVDILAGPEANHVRIDEGRVAEQVASELGKFVELDLEQHLVDAQRAEVAAVLLGEVLGDEPDEPGVVRAGEFLEILAQLAGVHLARLEPLQRRRLEAVEAPALVRRLRALRERLPADELGIKARRQRALAGDLSLVVEAQAQLVAEVLQRLVGIRLIAKQGPAVLNLDDLRACAALAALEPLLDDGVDLLQLARRLVAEALVVVVLVGSGDELLDRLVLVLGQDVAFHEAYFLGRRRQGRHQHRRQYQKCAFHRKSPLFMITSQHRKIIPVTNARCPMFNAQCPTDGTCAGRGTVAQNSAAVGLTRK